METTVARLTKPPEIPAELGPVRELLVRMTARSPEDRPGMAEVAVRLHELTSAQADAPDAPAPPVTDTEDAEPAAGPVLRLPLRHGLVGAAAALALAFSVAGVLGDDPTEQATATGETGSGTRPPARAGQSAPPPAPRQAPATTDVVVAEQKPVRTQPDEPGAWARERALPDRRTDRPKREGARTRDRRQGRDDRGGGSASRKRDGSGKVNGRGRAGGRGQN